MAERTEMIGKTVSIFDADGPGYWSVNFYAGYLIRQDSSEDSARNLYLTISDYYVDPDGRLDDKEWAFTPLFPLVLVENYPRDYEGCYDAEY